MINLETPKKAGALINQAHQAAAEVLRPVSRKYDRAEHTYPVELDMFAAVLDGLNSSGEGGAGAAGVRRASDEGTGNRNGANLNLVLGTMEMCWGDVGLLLAMPRQGLGNAAIGSVATDEQLKRHPREALRFCDMVRAHLNLPDLPDDLILGAQENYRKHRKRLAKQV